MGYLCDATAHGADGVGDHGVRVRGRSDDPWGTLWRALYQAASVFVPREVDCREHRPVCAVTLFLEFAPDKEDADREANPPLFGAWWNVQAKPPELKGGGA